MVSCRPYSSPFQVVVVQFVREGGKGEGGVREGEGRGKLVGRLLCFVLIFVLSCSSFCLALCFAYIGLSLRLYGGLCDRRCVLFQFVFFSL